MTASELAGGSPTVAARAMGGPEQIEMIARRHQNPEWLIAQRRAAWDLFSDTPLPSRVTHVWRYTDPRLFLAEPRTDDPRPGHGPAAQPAFLTAGLDNEALAGTAFSRDGQGVEFMLGTELKRAGVRLLDLHDAARSMPEVIAAHLGRLVGAQFGKFEAEINALWTNGIVIHVPRGVRIERPVQLLSLVPATRRHLHRLLVILEEDAALELIDEYHSDAILGDARPYAGGVVELYVGPHARLKYVPVINWSTATTSLVTQRAEVQANAQLETVLISLGSGLGKLDFGARLAGRGARSDFFGLAIATGRQHGDHHTVHHHQAGDTASNLHFKVVLGGQANSVYTGLIRIDDQAPNCEAYQENRNLVLSPAARAQSIPELEILNQNVRCTHGATVGKIDPEEVFYIASRGIDPQEAVRLIVSGFVAPILNRVPEAVRDRLHVLVHDRLAGGPRGR